MKDELTKSLDAYLDDPAAGDQLFREQARATRQEYQALLLNATTVEELKPIITYLLLMET